MLNIKELKINPVIKTAKPCPVQGVLSLFPRAILEIARVSALGAEKYGVPLDAVDYRSVPNASAVYREAELRHMLAEITEGEYNSKDGGMLHKAQKAWNALADLEILLDSLKT